MAYIKAWIAAAAAFLSTLLGEWTGPEDPFNTRDLIVATLAAIVTFGAVFSFPNRPAS